MAEYINVKALLDKAMCTNAYFQIKSIVTELPSVDAVPVVRCKECKYMPNTANANGFLICKASGMEITDDDFCSYGERKEDTDHG